MKFLRHDAIFLIVFVCGLVLSNPTWGREVSAPELQGIVHWINTDNPLTIASMKGKVVLVDFWTYSCVNCIRTLPYLVQWYQKYHARGLEIIGVHTPEFEFEKDISNVRAAVKRFNILYPVAMDNDYTTWNNYANRVWPAFYLIDKKGMIQYRQFGEGNYEKTERQIQMLLSEEGPVVKDRMDFPVSDGDLAKIKTPEIYLGYARADQMGNEEKVMPGKRQLFLAPKEVAPNNFYLVGEWQIEEEFAKLTSQTGKVVLRYEASNANMVLKTVSGEEILVEVWIDGQPATLWNKGTDVYLENGKAICKISFPRLYHFAATKAGKHILELRITSPGLEAYTFTFG